MTFQVCDCLKLFLGRNWKFSISTSSGPFSMEGSQRNSVPEHTHLYHGCDAAIISSSLGSELGQLCFHQQSRPIHLTESKAHRQMWPGSSRVFLAPHSWPWKVNAIKAGEAEGRSLAEAGRYILGCQASRYTEQELNCGQPLPRGLSVKGPRVPFQTQWTIVTCHLRTRAQGGGLIFHLRQVVQSCGCLETHI